jgi:hypothetical protein
MNQATLQSTPVRNVVTRPILFSGPMVRALLNGAKTQTRRIVKPQPPDHAIEVFDWRAPHIAESAKASEGCYFNDMDGLHFHCKSPYGTIGDRLWVRETFRKTCDDKAWGCVQYKADESIRLILCDNNGEGDPIGTKPHKEPLQRVGKKGPPFKPSIHMPRWASRITLEITSVRIERLNAISNADCVAEGIEPIGEERDIGKCCGKIVKTQVGQIDGKHSTVRQLYSELWESINGPGSWARNPWVWVVEFKIV